MRDSTDPVCGWRKEKVGYFVCVNVYVEVFEETDCGEHVSLAHSSPFQLSHLKRVPTFGKERHKLCKKYSPQSVTY